MHAAIYALFERAFHRPPPSHTVIVIADWITAKEEYEADRTSTLFIRYQDAITTLLNDEDARHVMTHLLKARRLYAGD